MYSLYEVGRKRKMCMVADTPSMFVEMSFNILRGKFVKMDYIDENLVEC